MMINSGNKRDCASGIRGLRSLRSIRRYLIYFFVAVSIFAGSSVPLSLGKDPLDGIEIGSPVFLTIKLKGLDVNDFVPKDPRNLLELARCEKRFDELFGVVPEGANLKVVLPEGINREALLLSAVAFARAKYPKIKIYVSYSPGVSWNDERTWRAVDGGLLSEEDRVAQRGDWGKVLQASMEYFPGTKWWLVLTKDPGGELGEILGMGGGVIVSNENPISRFLGNLKNCEINGKQNSISVVGLDGHKIDWKFLDGKWVEDGESKATHEVEISGRNDYDLQGLLARVRTHQVQKKLFRRGISYSYSINLRLFNPIGADGELGFDYEAKEGFEGEVLLSRKNIYVNGIKLNKASNVEIPLLEPNKAVAIPLEISLSEEFEYFDLGQVRPGIRRVGFRALGAEGRNYSGVADVIESSGVVFRIEKNRKNLSGVIKSEKLVEQFYEPIPNFWALERINAEEEWASSIGLVRVTREFLFGGYSKSDTGDAFNSVPDLYINKKDDKANANKNSEEVNRQGKVRGMAFTAMAILDPGLRNSVIPGGGLQLYDFRWLDRNIQANCFVSGLFNSGNVFVAGENGIDFSSSFGSNLLTQDLRPITEGRMANSDSVGYRVAHVDAQASHDIFGIVRGGILGKLQYNWFGDPVDKRFETKSYVYPKSGLQQEIGVWGSSIYNGIELKLIRRWGKRADSEYGPASKLTRTPNGGIYRTDFASLSTSKKYEIVWIKGSVSYEAGLGLDRFNAINIGGGISRTGIGGIQSNSMASDRVIGVHLQADFKGTSMLNGGLKLSAVRARDLYSKMEFEFSGLTGNLNLPGFWFFSTTQLEAGFGLKSDIKGVRNVTGSIILSRYF